MNTDEIVKTLQAQFDKMRGAYEVMSVLAEMRKEENESLQAQLAAWNRRAQPENEPLVRCGNCKHYNRIGCVDGFGWCERMDRGTDDDFYCSLVERSEGL